MNFLRRLFGSSSKATHGPAEQHAVLVYLDGTGLPDEVYTECDLATLEDRLHAAIARVGAGEYDGNEFGETETTLFMYGPDAEKLFSAIEPVLRAYPLCRNARIIIRKGGPGGPQRELKLPAA